ncbi:MAG: 6-bladed beta-propeller [Balneolaceae bacterium]
MKKKKLSLTMTLIVMLFCAFCMFSCKKKEEGSTTEAVLFKIESDTTYFSFENSDVFLGNIRDISVDETSNIYLLDRSDNLIKKFDKQGNFERSFLSGIGHGPGETQQPNALHIDKSGNIYVTDQSENKLIIVDADNQLIAESVIGKMPSSVVASGLDQIYVVGFRHSYRGNLVTSYSINDQQEIVERVSLVERNLNEDNIDLVGMTGFSDKISIDSFENLYFNWTFPYKVEVYNSADEKFIETTRDIPFFRYPERSGGMVKPFAVGRDVLPLSENLFAVRYTDLSDIESPVSYLDFYNLNGELLGSHSFTELGMSEQGNHYTSASHGSENAIYVLHNNPSTHLIKHVFKLE